MIAFRRGFKSWCEATSLQFRVALGLRPTDPLPAARLAAHIGARVVTPREVPGLGNAANRQLVERDPSSWSAVTVTARSRHVIVVNPAHSPGRMSNDLMHECAHIILNHVPAKAILSADRLLMMSAYDRLQEAEADWLAAVLLLPRPALLSVAAAPSAAAARSYGVSEDLLQMRLNVTGVRNQAARRRA